MIKGFAQVPNSVLWDKNLSMKAKGLWAYIRSKPPNYDFSADRIAQETKESRRSILAGLAELQNSGYLHRHRLPSGRVAHKVFPVVTKVPDSYEPPIPFNECREQIQRQTGMSPTEAQASTQEFTNHCYQAQIKRSDFALRSWITHEKATVPKQHS